MILPKKHIKLSESLFGIGAVILKELDDPKSVDELWDFAKSNKAIDRITFDTLILTLDYLYTINVLKIDDEGRVRNVLKKTER